MIAYNPLYLKNTAIVKKAKQWFSKQLISSDQMQTVLKNYTTAFYSPNFFIRIGLFVFTFAAIIAAMGFYGILFGHLSNFSRTFFVVACLLFGSACVFFLEYFIQNKKVYRAGVDECLLYSALCLIIAAICIILDFDEDSANHIILLCIFALPFIAVSMIRYTDWVVALLLIVCLYSIFFFTFLKIGKIAELLIPFAMMAVSVPVYIIAVKQKQQPKLFYWKKCVTVFECAALIVFYLSGNYFVIREASVAFFGLQVNEGADIPMAFIFYVFTAAVPLTYVYYGLKGKDKALLWTGLILIALAVLTFKYYFSLGHPEISLTAVGIILVTIAFLSIRFLKTPKYGITFEEGYDEDSFLKSHAEALVIVQYMGTHQTQDTSTSSSTEFGGGGFGGAGSGGNF